MYLDIQLRNIKDIKMKLSYIEKNVFWDKYNIATEYPRYKKCIYNVL